MREGASLLVELDLAAAGVLRRSLFPKPDSWTGVLDAANASVRAKG